MPDSAPSTHVRFRLLGPLEVVGGVGPIPVTARRQRVALSTLLLESNHVVSVERLVDALWSEDPPATARSQVHICISMLRKLLDGSSAELVSRPNGYMLRVPDHALDLWQFLRCNSEAAKLAESQPEEAVLRYREGLALWRGDACADVSSQIIRQAALRLDEERRVALETCLDLELRLGHHREVIGELAEMVAAQPLRERPRALLMVALYRSGRQAEALDVFRLGRQIFVEELGADPGKELQSLEQAILTCDSSLDLPNRPSGVSAAPNAISEILPLRQLPATVADFVGRKDQLELARKALEASAGTGNAAGHVAGVMLTGRGGIGKTTLALCIANAMRDSFCDGQLFARLRESGGPASSPQAILNQFLRSLGVPAPVIPGTLPELTAMFRSCLASRRVLVVLDDAVSSSQIEPLLPGGCGCGVIITSRNRIVGPPGITHLEVGLLESHDAAELLEHIVGRERLAAEPEATTGLIRLCEGLPLALRIAASKLVTRPHWRVGRMVERLADERHRLDELDLEGMNIRATLEFSYRSLPPRAQSLLPLLSLLEQGDFPGWVSAPLLDMPVTEAEDALEDLVAAGLVEARMVDGSGRYRMHDMVRLFAREKLAEGHQPADRLAALHRYLKCWLTLVSEAHRRYHGGDFYIVRGSSQAWPLARESIDEAMASPMHWFHKERSGLISAILLSAGLGFDELCWELAVTSVTFFELNSHPDDWNLTHETALAATRQAGNDRGTAALLYSLGLRSMSRDFNRARDYLRQSLEMWDRLDDEQGRSLTFAGLAHADRLAGKLNAAEKRYKQALRAFLGTQDLAGQASVLRGLGQIAMERASYEDAWGLLERSIAVARQAGAKRDMAQSMYYSAELLWRRGDLAQAEDRLCYVYRETQDSGDIVGQGYSLLGLGIVRTMTRAFSQAGVDLCGAEKLASRSGDALLSGKIVLALAELEIASDRKAHARALLTKAFEIFSRLDSSQRWQAHCRELAGRIAEEGTAHQWQG